jgi:hypothetical protein
MYSQNKKRCAEKKPSSTLGDWGIRDQSNTKLIASRLHPVFLRVPVYQTVIHLVRSEWNSPLLEALVGIPETFFWYPVMKKKEIGMA